MGIRFIQVDGGRGVHKFVNGIDVDVPLIENTFSNNSNDVFTLANLSRTLIFMPSIREDMPEHVKAILDVVDSELCDEFTRRHNEAIEAAEGRRKAGVKNWNDRPVFGEDHA